MKYMYIFFKIFAFLFFFGKSAVEKIALFSCFLYVKIEELVKVILLTPLTLPEEKLAIKFEEEKVKKQFQRDLKPFIEYKGKIKYYITFIDCAMHSYTLLNIANQTSDLLTIGFDLEWSFSYQTGPGKTAVIQISSSLDECLIFHVSDLIYLPKSLTLLLAHDKVRLTGVNIKNDVRKLSKDFPGIDTKKVIQNCVDLGSLANRVSSSRQRWSMEKLVDKFFDMRINKDKSVRNSKWHFIPLSKEQQAYAALDAYVSLKLFKHLKQIEANLSAKENNRIYLMFNEYIRQNTNK